MALTELQGNLFKRSVVTKTTTYTATVYDDVILVTTGSAWTLTLPTAVGNTGRLLTVIKTSSDFNALTIDANSTETINGSLTTSINTQYERIELISDGSNWHIAERRIPSTWTSYTPIFVGLGTVSPTNIVWRRVGPAMEIQGDFTTGTCTASNASMSLPSGPTIYSPSSSVLACGGLVPSTTTNPANRHLVALMTNGDTALYFSQTRTDSAVNPLVVQTGSGVFLNSNRYSTIGSIIVPITGWNG